MDYNLGTSFWLNLHFNFPQKVKMQENAKVTNFKSMQWEVNVHVNF